MEQLLEEKKQQKFWLVWAAAAALILLLGLVFVIIGITRTNMENALQTTVETTSPFEENPYGPEDFQQKDGFLTCLAGESVLGIDVSSFQGEIDWQAVADAGIDFVMIRVGGRGYGAEGVLYTDEQAQANYSGAKAAGLQVGGYFFSQAVSVEEAIEEAAYALRQIKDWELDMPLVFDWEYLGEQARTADVDKRTLTDCTLAFCKTVALAGYEPMIYFNPNQSDNHIYLEELTDYRGWLAMYTQQMTYPYRVDMWQYTNAGSVPGIEGPVDINLYFPY